jgi:hypothetical protein
VLSASTLDTLSRASLSAWAAHSSSSLTRAVVLSQVAAASYAEVSVATWTTCHAQATSAHNAGMSALTSG